LALVLRRAAWIDPMFGVWVYDRIEELLRSGPTAIYTDPNLTTAVEMTLAATLSTAEKMKALTPPGKRGLQPTSAIAACAGEGLTETKGLLAGIDTRTVAPDRCIQAAGANLMKHVGQVMSRPKAPCPFGGRDPTT
jgi:hypothetical protein